MSRIDRSPAAYLQPANFKTGFDTRHKSTGYAEKQYKHGLETGHEFDPLSHPDPKTGIYINARGVWSASRPRRSVQSYETIGYHAATAPLLQGFLDSGARIFVMGPKGWVQIAGPGAYKFQAKALVDHGWWDQLLRVPDAVQVLADQYMQQTGKGAPRAKRNRRKKRRSGRHNPSIDGVDFYDPRSEQLRAQTTEIFLQSLTGDETQEELRKKASRAFRITTGRGQKYQWFLPHSRTPTKKAVHASQERYAGTYIGSDGNQRTLDDLVNNRQSYETMLALARKGDFYRIVAERTRRGLRFFVWPMPPGVRVPGPGKGQAAAEREAAKLNRHADPRKTGRWWTPQEGYSRPDLVHWLPPKAAFG